MVPTGQDQNKAYAVNKLSEAVQAWFRGHTMPALLKLTMISEF